jgi:hypothetical protein
MMVGSCFVYLKKVVILPQEFFFRILLNEIVHAMIYNVYHD